MNPGILLRDAKADLARIRGLVSQTVGWPCSHLIGRALWLDPGAEPELTKGMQVANPAELDLRGDFGHLFGKTAELRWRRIDEQHYDVLILGALALKVPGTTELGGPWVIETKARFHQLRTVYYRAPNGAVQFVSYREEG